MIAAADELDDLKRRHARQMQDVEEERLRKERELRSATEALSGATDDLARERETTRALKACSLSFFPGPRRVMANRDVCPSRTLSRKEPTRSYSSNPKLLLCRRSAQLCQAKRMPMRVANQSSS